MKFLIKYIALALISIVLASCSSMLYTNIDVLRPAKITFPADIDRVWIINNSEPQPVDYGHVTELFNEKRRKISVDADSLAIFSLAAFAEAVEEKEFFSITGVEYNSLKKGSDFLLTSPPADSAVADLARIKQVNGIISLNRIIVNDDVAEIFNQEDNTFTAYMEARYEKHWSIHYPEKQQVFNLITKDTVYWESESYYRQRALNGLPDRRDALIDGALITGGRDVNKFIPYWEEVERYFFSSNNKAFKQGMDAVYKKDWDVAITNWESYLLKSNNDIQKAKAAHNLAVVYEIKGNIEKAYEYSNKSLECFMNTVVVNYQHLLFVIEQNTDLKTRLAELKVLNRQLGE